MSTPVIEAKALTKRYRGALAVDRLDLTVERDEVFGLLGPNGAGKTTTILMILGLTEPTSGSITTVGYDPLRQPLEVKRRVGYLPDSVGFYDHMTGRDNLRFIARLGGLRPDQIERSIETALERVRLAEVADRPVGTYSRGMRQRLGIAEILMRKVEVAILDEPSSGLDPQTTREFLELIRSLKAEGMTVLLSSHLLDLVQIQVMDIASFQAIRPALDELEAARTLGLQSREVLRETAASPFVRRDGHGRLAGLLGRILRHPELELRIFLAPRELDVVIEGVVHVLCFENGAEYSLTSLVGPNWVVLDSAFAAFIDLDWFRATFLDVDPASDQLAYPRRGAGRCWLLSRDDVARLAAGVRPFLDEPATAPEVRSAAEGLARLAAKVLSAEDLALAYTSLL